MQGCRRRWPAVWLSACSAALVLAGCGSGGRRAEAPKLPAPLAWILAGLSDQVAVRLDAGDSCGAATTAKDLQQRTIGSMASVPAELQESLESAVNDLADRAQAACTAASPPPPPPVSQPPTSPPPKHGKGHGKDHKKHGGDEGGGD